MLGGQVTVFVSCSERFKQAVAWPVRDALASRGLRGLIVSDEPALPGTGEHPEAKVESYLNASSAFVALCTADYGLSDGTTYPRANIIDEIQLASLRPHLRDRSQILKSPEVLLPSSITPTYDRLDIASPSRAAEIILKQLEERGVTNPPAPRRAVEAGTGTGHDADDDLCALLADLQPGDRDEASRRAYRLLVDATSCDGRRRARLLHREVTDAQDHARQLAGASLLQAMSRLDASLVSVEMIEILAAHPEYPARSCAANLLRDRAVVAPLDVPLGVLGRLISPSTEDWYVWAPAAAAVKELVLSRPDAWVIFESLSTGTEAQDRHTVAQALLEVAEVRPATVARNLAERLLDDLDPLVAEKAREVLTAIEHVTDAERAACYARFRL
jgi:hypothetical protein